MRGVSLVETLLSIALIVIIGGISIPVYYGFHVRNNVDVAVNYTVQGLRRAQGLAKAVYGDSQWGVKIQPGSIVIFKGPSYSERDIDFDEIYEIADNINISGISEIAFSKFIGSPSVTGSITFTSVTGDIRTVSINTEGTVAY